MANTTVQKQLLEALSYHRGGDIDQAEKRYQSILSEHPDNTDALSLYGVLLGQKKAYHQAQRILEKAIRIEPNRPDLYNNLANVFKHQKKTDLAIAQYEKAQRLKSDNPISCSNLGILYQQLGDLDKAETYYRKAIAIDPKYADAHYHLGMLFAHRQDSHSGIQYLKQAIAADDKHDQAHGQIAQLLHEQGHLQEAVSHYEKQLCLTPEDPDLHHRLAAALVNQKVFERAIDHFLSAIRLEPEHKAANDHLGRLYLTQEQYSKALQYLLRHLQIEPSAASYYNVACAYMCQNKLAESFPYFEQVIALEANHLAAHINLGAICLKRKDYEPAVQFYRKAQALDPDNPEIDYILQSIEQKPGKQGFTQSPAAYVTRLFDDYASYFDQHLTKQLNYRAPQQLYEAFTDTLGLNQAELVILDMGCGTGLCGPVFQPLSKHLIGMDLSANMLAVARKKTVYQELIQGDIIKLLKRCSESFDLVVAADVLPYFGRLEEVFRQVTRCLKQGGYYIFTVEKTYSEPYLLQRSARFAHARTYIDTLSQSCGFQVVRWDNISTRKQDNHLVEGYLYILRFKGL